MKKNQFDMKAKEMVDKVVKDLINQQNAAYFHSFRFYFNKKTYQAFGVLGRTTTISFGNCLVCEVVSPFQMPVIMPLSPFMEPDDWTEIEAKEFKRLIGEYGKIMNGKRLSWWNRCVQFVCKWNGITEGMLERRSKEIT